MPLVRYTHHVHVWRSLLERAGFTLADIPKEWGPFWSFWCDKVQPAVRKATGRDDIFGIGRPDVARGDRDTWRAGPVRRRPHARLARALGREPGRRPDRAGDPGRGAQAVHRDLREGLHPAAVRRLDQSRQQRRLPRPERRHDDQPDALDPERDPARAAGGLPRERGDDRLAERRLRASRCTSRATWTAARCSPRGATSRRRWSSCGSWSGTAGSGCGRASRGTATCRCWRR